MAINRYHILRHPGVWIFCIGFLMFWSPAAYSEEIRCEREIIWPDGGKHLIDLKLILQKKGIVGLIFRKIESFTAKGNPMALWTCTVDTTHLEENHRITWSRKRNRTSLEIVEKDTGDISTVRIDKSGKGYKVFFVVMSRYYSGMTQFPDCVLIERGNKECVMASR
jgi:hypothetical protein